MDDGVAETARDGLASGGSSSQAAEPRLLICLATYNEIGNLPKLLDAIWRELPAADVLVIDDNSPDGTGQWCLERARDDRRLQVLIRSGKLGLGSATWAAMEHGVARHYEWLITMDADFSHPPEVLPRMVATALRGQWTPAVSRASAVSPSTAAVSGSDPAGGATVATIGAVDVILGSRYIDGGGVDGWPWRRRLMSRGVNGLARFVLRLPVRDTSGAYRCYRVASLVPILSGPMVAHGYAFFEEILWRLKRQGARFIEIPFVFRERQAGYSKLNWREAFRALGIILWLGGVERGWFRDAPTSTLGSAIR